MASTMDPLIKSMAAISRSIAKCVDSAESRDAKLMVIQMAERKLKELKDGLGSK